MNFSIFLRQVIQMQIVTVGETASIRQSVSFFSSAVIGTSWTWTSKVLLGLRLTITRRVWSTPPRVSSYGTTVLTLLNSIFRGCWIRSCWVTDGTSRVAVWHHSQAEVHRDWHSWFLHVNTRIRFPKLLAAAAGIMAMFGSTYVCEQFFSSMKLNKSALRSRLTFKTHRWTSSCNSAFGYRTRYQAKPGRSCFCQALPA